MRAIVTWLLARPQHAVLGLAGSFLLPPAQIFGASILVMLMLAHGTQRTLLIAAGAAVFLLVLALLPNTQLLPQLPAVGLIWLLVSGAAWMLRRNRSLVLTVQMLVVISLCIVVTVFFGLDDPAAYWIEFFAPSVRALEDAGMAAQFEQVISQSAPVMTAIVVAGGWSATVLALFLGYAGYRLATGAKPEFGSFQTLNLGKVLAAVTLTAAILATLTQWPWIANLALFLLLVFFTQGLAVVHWLAARAGLPVFVLIGAYVLLLIPPFSAFLWMGLAVFGYVDAWIDLRRRVQSPRPGQ